MRVVVVAATLILAACGTHGPSGVVPVTPTPRVTTAATRDCPTVSWVKHYRSLTEIGYDSEVVVRAIAIAQDVVQLKAFAGGAVTLRDATRTTFRVTSTLRTNGPAESEMRVLEDVCANLEVRPGEEWVLFLYRWDPAYGPDDPHAHWIAAGGPQGQFRISGGVVTGPFYVFADVVHSYEGAPVAELLRDIATLPHP